MKLELWQIRNLFYLSISFLTAGLTQFLFFTDTKTDILIASIFIFAATGGALVWAYLVTTRCSCGYNSVCEKCVSPEFMNSLQKIKEGK